MKIPQRYFILTANSLEELERGVNEDLNKDLRREPVGPPFRTSTDDWGQIIFVRDLE